MLEATELPEETKSMIKGELGLRESGVWVGQPDLRMARIKSSIKGFIGAFVVTIICVVLGGAGGMAIEGFGWLVGIAAVVLWLILVPIMFVAAFFLDSKAARNTAYVITTKRCIVYQAGWFGSPDQESFYPDLLAQMNRMQSWFFGANAGDLVFRSVTTITTTYSRRNGTSTSSSTTYYGFLGINNLDEAERMIRETLLSGDDDDDDDDDDEDEKPKKKKKKKSPLPLAA